MIELKNSKKTYLGEALNGRKRYHLECHIGAIQMKEDGVWYDIDPTLNKNGLSKRVPYIVTPYLTGMPGFHYKSKQSGEFDVRLREARSISLRGRPTIVQPTIPVPIIVGKQIIWRDAYKDTDVVLQFSNTRVSLKRILKSAKAPTEYDIDSKVLEEGIAQILPLRPAIDANGQSLVMEEAKIAGGRTERLKLEVIPEAGIEPQSITYPIIDPYDIEEQVGADLDDTYMTSSTNYNTSTSAMIGNFNSSLYSAGVRFLGLNLAQGTTIDAALLRCYFWTTSFDDPLCDIYCQDGTATPEDFHDDNDLVEDRARTSLSVELDETGLGVGWHNTDSLVNPIQEVSTDHGITDLVLLLIGKGVVTQRGMFRTWDYDVHALGAKLDVDYTEEGGPETVEGVAAGSGIGLAETTAKLDVLAIASGQGIGLAQSSSYLIVPATASGQGIGLGVGSAYLEVLAQVQASGIGSATVQAILDVLAGAGGSGIGLGSTEALIHVLAAAAASGEGLAEAEAFLEVIAEAVGKGIGSAIATGGVVVEVIIVEGEGAGSGIGTASVEALINVLAEATGHGIGEGSTTKVFRIILHIRRIKLGYTLGKVLPSHNLGTMLKKYTLGRKVK